jgi:hypothetical protein
MNTARPSAEERHVAWKARELAKAPPLTQEQLADLRRVLLPPEPLARPA